MLPHWPQRRRVTRDVAALAARLVVPELLGRDLLFPAEQGLHRRRFVLITHTMNDDLAILLEFVHVLADVVHPVAEVDRAAVDVLAHPVGRLDRILAGQIGGLEERTVAGNALTIGVVETGLHRAGAGAFCTLIVVAWGVITHRYAPGFNRMGRTARTQSSSSSSCSSNQSS